LVPIDACGKRRMIGNEGLTSRAIVTTVTH
jgi:hypothetical protein